MTNEPLKEGEEYLRVKITIGSLEFYLPAYKVKDRKSNGPIYSGPNIAIWKNKKKPEIEKVQEEDI